MGKKERYHFRLCQIPLNRGARPAPLRQTPHASSSLLQTASSTEGGQDDLTPRFSNKNIQETTKKQFYTPEPQRQKIPNSREPSAFQQASGCVWLDIGSCHPSCNKQPQGLRLIYNTPRHPSFRGFWALSRSDNLGHLGVA